MEKVTFKEMKSGTEQEFKLLFSRNNSYCHTLPTRLLALLKQMELEDDGGYPVNRLQHALQTATRAFRDNASDEWVVAALLHDIGDMFSPENHSAAAAEILKPYVSEEIYWVIRHHGIFQGYYYWEYSGRDKNARELFREHPYFEATERFCERWDQCSFDPDYDMFSLEFFEPIVTRVFTKQTKFSVVPA